jgi:hypothetical protein
MAPRRSVQVRRWWRRVGLPACAVVLTVGLLASDWPVDWSFWAQHPVVSSLLPGLVLLLVAAVLVDGFVRRREARRWREVGAAASGALTDHFIIASLVMDSLLGIDINARLDLDLDYHLEAANERMGSLVGEGQLEAWTFELGRGGGDYDDRVARLLPVALGDEVWRDSIWSCLSALNRRHAQLLSQWASIYAASADEENFRRLGETVRVIDLAAALQTDVAAAQDAESLPAGEADLDAGEPVEDVVARWISLKRAVVAENRYWRLLRQSQTSLGDRAEGVGELW